MAIIPSRLRSNTLTGTVKVINNHANISLPLSEFAFIGDRQITVKLRRNSPTGDILKQTPPITIKDFAEVNQFFSPVNYVFEGSSLTFTLRTANVVDGSMVHYTVNPTHPNVNSNDFLTTSGYARIENNTTRFTISANTDSSPVSEDGETFKIILRADGPTGNIITESSNILIVDTSSTVPGDLSANTTKLIEGSSIVFTIDPAYYSDGTLLYYKTVGNVTSSDFVQANLSTSSVQSNVFSLTLDTSTNIPLEEERTFYLEVRQDFQNGTLVGRSANITIIDSQSIYANAVGGQVSIIEVGGERYKLHTFKASTPASYEQPRSTITYTPSSWESNFAGRQEFKILRLPYDSSTKLEYLLVGAGGGGGSVDGTPTSGFFTGGGGGGGGGVIEGNIVMNSSIASNVQVHIGQGRFNINGIPSRIDEWNLIAYGGGYGGRARSPGTLGFAGSLATGGGQGYGAVPADLAPSPTAVKKNASPIGVSLYPEQGTPGLAAPDYKLGGGGGGGGPAILKDVGTPGSNTSGVVGYQSNITGSSVFYGGGGGGGRSYQYPSTLYGRGGNGGGGTGGYLTPPATTAPRTFLATNGTVHTGGGGGGAIKAPPGGSDVDGGRGGPGIVILRYPIGPA